MMVNRFVAYSANAVKVCLQQKKKKKKEEEKKKKKEKNTRTSVPKNFGRVLSRKGAKVNSSHITGLQNAVH